MPAFVPFENVVLSKASSVGLQATRVAAKWRHADTFTEKTL